MDLNADGIDDIIVGSYYGDRDVRTRTNGGKRYDEQGDYWGDIFIFYGNEDGSYQPRQVLANALMHPVPYPIDWDGDGDFDLITTTWGTGSYAGDISLMENVGTPSEPSFAYPTTLIEDESSYASVVVHDWNGDGLVDLLAGGYMDGSIFLFPNQGTVDAPAFKQRTVLAQGLQARDKWDVETTTDVPWGMSLQLHVVDWDGDGVSDLLVGDNASFRRPRPGLDEAELARIEEARKTLDRLTEQVRSGEKVDIDAMTAASRITYSAEVIEGHGRVWLFKGRRGTGDADHDIVTNTVAQQGGDRDLTQSGAQSGAQAGGQQQAGDLSGGLATVTGRSGPVAFALSASQSIVAGRSFELTMTIDMQPTWHISGPKGGGAQSIPTDLTLTLPDGIEADGGWVWPPANYMGAEPGYQGAGVVVTRKLRASRDVAEGAIDITCAARFQTCDPQKCLPPSEVKLVLQTTVKRLWRP